MKQIKNKISWLSLAALVFTLIFNGCKEDDDLGMADRLFRPVISETSYGGTWIRLVWDKYASADSYQLQLSTDTFKTITTEIETDTIFYRFDDLDYDTNYFIRIKSIGESLESNYFENEVIRTSDYPTKLENISSVTDTEVKVTWTDVTYDSLLVTRGDTVDISYTITDAENNAKAAVIGDLTPETSYFVRAYLDGEYQGKKSFETSALQIFEGDVVDLRTYTPEESYELLSQTFFDDLATNYPNGVTVVLKGGTTYELAGPILKSGFNLVAGLSVRGKAILEVTGNFDLDATANINKIYMEGIAFTDHPDHPRTDSNYGSTYVFNISQSGAAIDSIVFEDCDIRYKRGMMRIKTAATVNNISVNNCFIDSIAGYGVINLDNGEVVTKSISFTNSTIGHTELFLRSDKMAADLEKLVISNVTTYHTPKDYFFRMGNINDVNITNCLFGAVWKETGAEGLRAGTVTNSKIQDNYKTSDCYWIAVVDAEGKPTGEYKNPIEADDLGADSYAIFADPDNLDFTVTESKLVGKAGDPRWW
ncbi:DUF5123 domain-containing protein [Mangrovibacterium lignilyticum]|uniref:DUF5123 domain-containing protein n=1 Tax=Mangrovibacterium lignilyticum TaxID=2668052 RepID=UPI0013CF6802|nr:DUF5123 domain-containing protein [Mangrovibacterium lignilyticum]